MRPLLPAILTLTAMALGCGNKGGDAQPSGSASAAAPGSAAPAAAHAVDPKIDAMARAVLPCKAFDTSFDFTCPAMKAWVDAKDDFADGKADASLVAMLGDADEKIRYLGAYKLNAYGKAFKTDKALAEAVVAAGEKEKSKFCAYEVGSSVGRVDVNQTGTFDRVKALVKKNDLVDMRRGILGQLLFNNQDFGAVYAFTKETVKDPDKTVALAALGAFWTGGTRRPADTCQIYADNIDNPVDDLAADASNALSWFGQCSAKYDMLLDSLDKRAKAGAVGSASYATSARHVCEDAKSNDKQKKRAATIGHEMAQKKTLQGWVRASALETVMKCDPKGGSFVGKLKGDADKTVSDKAKELLTKK